MLRKRVVRQQKKLLVPDGKNLDLSLADHAYRVLEELIITLQLQPGAALSEQALASRLNMGRTPIREALRRLDLS